MPRLSLFMVSAVLFSLASPAQAHRDGCHRWHSCPSDTGSYTMGRPVTTPAVRPVVVIPGTYRITTSTANLRRSPSTSAAILTVIPRGTRLTVACPGTWCRTSYRGQAGYVAGSLTRSAAGAPVVVRRAATGASASYPTCSAARAAGVTPILVGQPGYRRALDRDGDDVACE